MQHLFALDKEKICGLLFDGKACLYICGNGSMSKTVQGLLKQWLAEREGDAQKAQTEFSRLQSENRIYIDAWGR